MTRRQSTILLCEDEDSLRRLLVRVLESAGFDVLPAADAATCRQLAAGTANAIDLLITDLTLPDAGGAELAEELRADHPGLRVLYMSGFGAEALAQRGIEIAAGDLLEKPFRASEIVARVESLLGNPGGGPGSTRQDLEGAC